MEHSEDYKAMKYLQAAIRVVPPAPPITDLRALAEFPTEADTWKILERLRDYNWYLVRVDNVELTE